MALLQNSSFRIDHRSCAADLGRRRALFVLPDWHRIVLSLTAPPLNYSRSGSCDTHTHTYTHTDTQTHRRTDIHTHRHTDAQTHRHTHTQTHRRTDAQTDTRTVVCCAQGQAEGLKVVTGRVPKQVKRLRKRIIENLQDVTAGCDILQVVSVTTTDRQTKGDRDSKTVKENIKRELERREISCRGVAFSTCDHVKMDLKRAAVRNEPQPRVPVLSRHSHFRSFTHIPSEL